MNENKYEVTLSSIWQNILNINIRVIFVDWSRKCFKLLTKNYVKHFIVRQLILIFVVKLEYNDLMNP